MWSTLFQVEKKVVTAKDGTALDYYKRKKKPIHPDLTKLAASKFLKNLGPALENMQENDILYRAAAKPGQEFLGKDLILQYEKAMLVLKEKIALGYWVADDLIALEDIYHNLPDLIERLKSANAITEIQPKENQKILPSLIGRLFMSWSTLNSSYPAANSCDIKPTV